MTTPLPPHDDDLPGEAELKALYDRLPWHEPGPALDATVLRAAAEAVTSDASPRHTRRRWPVALGTAATLVLAAGLAWHVREMPADIPAASPASAPTISPASADLDAARSVQAAKQLDDAAARNTETAAMQARRGESARQSAAVAKQATVAEESRAYAPPALKAQSRAAPSSAPAANGIAAPKPATPVAPAPAPATEEQADRAAPLREAVSATPAPPAPMAAPVPLPAMPAPPAPPAVTTQAAPAPQAASPSTAMPADAPSLLMNLRAVEPEETMTPAMAAELQAIRLLYAHGDTTAARARLDAFHREHPHAVLPPDLQRQLDTTP